MSAIKQARLHRGWSQARLISEIQRQAPALGFSTPGVDSLKPMLSRWENGWAVPSPDYRRVLAVIFASSPGQLGLPEVDQPAYDASLGLRRSSVDWAQDVKTARDLWEADVDRRGFLRTAGFSATAASVPIRTALLGTIPNVPESGSGRRLVTAADIATISAVTATYRALDNRYGGGQVRAAAVAFLRDQVAPLLDHGSFSAGAGSSLFRAAAELTQLVGWMSFDIGLAGLGQRHMNQACNLAKHADDDALVGEILAAMSHHASNLGAYSEAVDLAQAAGILADRAGVAALKAEASVMEAHGHAGRRDRKQCAQAIARAEGQFDRNPGDDPAWISYLDEAYLAAKFGHCFKALGDAATATTQAERSLIMDPGYVRGRVFNLVLLAHSHAIQGNIEQACEIGSQAADAATDLKSVRAKKYLRELRDQLAPAASSTHVRSLDVHLQPVLAA